jgi:glucose-1-phosphate cytidylyltransferase
MVEVGGQPLIWHILKHYETHGSSDFYVALVYKRASS